MVQTAVFASDESLMFQRYYKLGYAHNIIRLMSCRLVSHIFQRMDQQIKASR